MKIIARIRKDLHFRYTSKSRNQILAAFTVVKENPCRLYEDAFGTLKINLGDDLNTSGSLESINYLSRAKYVLTLDFAADKFRHMVSQIMNGLKLVPAGSLKNIEL